MSLRLNWSAANAALADAVNVYRSLTAIDPAVLPTPLATLGGNTQTYDDTTAARNTVYNYSLGFTKGADMLVTPNQVIGHFPDSGPGPQTLKRGDWNLGYFGTCTGLELFLPSDLRNSLGMTIGTVATDASFTKWYKFIRQGKILFIPDRILAMTVSWVQLYNAGLVYGTDDNGAYPAGSTVTGLTPTNQKRIATKGAWNFLVRLPRVLPGVRDSVIPTSGAGSGVLGGCVGSEWSQTMGRISPLSATFSTGELPQWDDSPPPAQNGLTQNWYNTANIWTTGATSACWADLSNTPATNAAMNWSPVLELVL